MSYDSQASSQSYTNTVPHLNTSTQFHQLKNFPKLPPKPTSQVSTDFVLSDFFAGPSKTSTDAPNTVVDASSLPLFNQQQDQEHLKQLYTFLFGPLTDPTQAPKADAQITQKMSSVPATPPPLVGFEDGPFKPIDSEFDPLSFLNDFDSIPIDVTNFHETQDSNIALANAFQVYRRNSDDTSPMLSSFDADEVSPPLETPALVADDGSNIPSPVWGNLHFFPEQTAPTISPNDLSFPLPLPEELAAVAASLPEQVTSTTKSKKRQLSPLFDYTQDDDDAFVPAMDERPAKKPRQSAATFNGTRKSAATLAIDAPTQGRTYVGPASKTTKRAVPAAAAKKVAKLRAEAEVTGQDKSADINQSIEEKRRQNTLAARKSRMRKAEHLASLEATIAQQQEDIERLNMEKAVWEARARELGWSENLRA